MSAFEDEEALRADCEERSADDWTRAFAALDALVERVPHEATAWVERGLARLEWKAVYDPDKGNPQEDQLIESHNALGAIGDFRRALALDPCLAEAQRGLGRSLREEDCVDQAIEAYGVALQLEPGHGETWNLRGTARCAAGDLRGALADYAKAIELEPSNASAWNNRGRTFHDLQDDGAARLDYLEAIRLDPTVDVYHRNLGELELGAGRTHDAAQRFTVAIDLASSLFGGALSHQFRASAYAALGLWNAAESDYTAAIRHWGPWGLGELYRARSLARRAQGKIDEAEDDLEQGDRLAQRG